MVAKPVTSPSSSAAPRVGNLSDGSKVAKSNRCPRTKTFATISPAPPEIPNGALWHPAQELASGADILLNAREPVRGNDGSDKGRPVPFVSGRPPPSSSVQFASNK